MLSIEFSNQAGESVPIVIAKGLIGYQVTIALTQEGEELYFDLHHTFVQIVRLSTDNDDLYVCEVVNGRATYDFHSIGLDLIKSLTVI